MPPFRLMDLDLLVQKGMKSRPFMVKVKDSQVNMGALQYALERILCFKAQGCSICILRQDPKNEEDVVSARDPLSRLCYEILSDKLETFGFFVKSFETRKELEEFAFDICNRGFRGVNSFVTVRAMVNCPKLYTLINMSRAIAIDSEVAVNIDVYDACDDELEVPMLAYPMLFILKEYFPDKYETYYKLFLKKNDPSEDLCLPVVMAEFIKDLCDNGEITQETCIEVIKGILALHDGLDNPIDQEKFSKFNQEGAETVLTGFNMKTALELIGVYEINYTKQSSVINAYLKNKLNDYVSGEYSLDNLLSLETNYFSEISETVKDKDGTVVSSNRNDEFMSEEELLNEFL